MKQSILKLRGSLVPAILAAASLLGLLMYQGWAEDGRSGVGAAYGEVRGAVRSAEVGGR